jgi:acetyltransferase-like isoleucine patch superfamily enzyme
MRWFQDQMGTGILEERTLSELVRGINGRLLQALAMYLPVTPAMRVAMQRARGVKIGKDVFMGIEVFIDPAYPHLVEIEDFVSLAGRNIIFCHSVATFPMREEGLVPPKIAGVRIKRGAWLALGSIILPGVTVGENSIVAAGAVVTKDVPAYSVAAGTPARVIRRLERGECEHDI